MLPPHQLVLFPKPPHKKTHSPYKYSALSIYMENEFSCVEALGTGQVGEVATYSDLFYHFYGQGG